MVYDVVGGADVEDWKKVGCRRERRRGGVSGHKDKNVGGIGHFGSR